VLEEEVYLILGNRAQYKDPAYLADFLFDFNDEKPREH